MAPLERVPVGGERDGVSLGARDADAPPAAAVGDGALTGEVHASGRVRVVDRGTQGDAELASRVAPERVHVPGGGEHDAVTVGGGDGDDSYPLEGPRDSPGRRGERFVARERLSRVWRRRLGGSDGGYRRRNGPGGRRNGRRFLFRGEVPQASVPAQPPREREPALRRRQRVVLASRHRHHAKPSAADRVRTDRVGTPERRQTRGGDDRLVPRVHRLDVHAEPAPAAVAPRVHSPVGGGAHGVKLTGGCADDAAARFPATIRIPGPARPAAVVVVGPSRGSVRGWDRHGDVVDASRRRLLAHRARAELKVDAAAPRVQIARQGRRRRRRRGGGGCGGAG